MSNNQDQLTEAEALDLAKQFVENYKKIEKQLREEYNAILKVKESFPKKYVGNEPFEDLVLKAADAKYRISVTARKLNGLTSEAKYELDFLIAQFKLYIADDALSEKFDKITEGLRDAYVNSKTDLKEFNKIVSKCKILGDSAEKLIRMFDGDEINFRRLLDRQKMMGF